MKIELEDMDVPYLIEDDVNDNGTDFIRIMPNSASLDRDEDYNLCLTIRQARLLAKFLNLMCDEIEGQ